MKFDTMTDPLLEIIPGDENYRTRNTGRKINIDHAIRATRSEFLGKPEICHAIVTNIIHLRRNSGDLAHQEQFWTRLSKYESTLLEHMNVRWLLSICDTIVDIGNYVQSAVAMNIVQCINRCNLDTTLLAIAKDGRLDENKLQVPYTMPTWGGMIAVNILSGDMIFNMQTRLDKVISVDSQLERIWNRIKDLSREEDGVIMNHICAASQTYERKFFL